MAPEQARGEAADFQSDLFMVGIVGYLLLTGRHPFSDSSGLFTIQELIADPDHAPEPPKPPSSIDPIQQRLHREYAAVIMRLLHRERASRFPSAREAIDALEAVQPFMECPECSERVREHYRFCQSCGTRLDAPGLPSREERTNEDGSDPETAQGLIQKGFLLTRNQQWGDAIATYRRAIEVAPDHQHGYWALGFALNHLDRFEEAIEVLTRGLALGSKSREHASKFQYALAYANANLKRYQEALDQLQRALSLQPEFPPALYLRARINVDLGNTEQALADATRVLARNPEHAGATRLAQLLGRRAQ
jgi:tetratricopeptide (TPR) repeat protein